MQFYFVISCNNLLQKYHLLKNLDTFSSCRVFFFCHVAFQAFWLWVNESAILEVDVSVVLFWLVRFPVAWRLKLLNYSKEACEGHVSLDLQPVWIYIFEKNLLCINKSLCFVNEEKIILKKTSSDNRISRVTIQKIQEVKVFETLNSLSNQWNSNSRRVQQ